MSTQMFLNGRVKLFRSPEYNYNFDLVTGRFERWGKTIDDDPKWSPFGPEIMDIEVGADGGCPMTCKFCYKGNHAGGETFSMDIDTFKKVLSTLPKVNGIHFCTQIAFGITSIASNPHLFDIFQHCRDNFIIPNVTINGADKISEEHFQKLIKLAGAMAISINAQNKELGYNLIHRLISNGANQINIHYMISKQSIDFAYKVCESIKNDPRLKGLNAIVFLGLKPKNRGQDFDVLPTSAFVDLVNHCLKHDVRFGFDSCSAPKFDKAIEISSLEEAQKKMLLSCSERCESGLFSSYVDSTGHYWHCSFGEGMEIAYGIDVTKMTDFKSECWLTPKMQQWRNRLFELNRECPLYSKIHVDPPAMFPHEVEKEQEKLREAKEKLEKASFQNLIERKNFPLEFTVPTPKTVELV